MQQPSPCRRSNLRALFLLLTVTLSAACYVQKESSGSGGDQSSLKCYRDTDCKGNRICQAGACADPAPNQIVPDNATDGGSMGCAKVGDNHVCLQSMSPSMNMMSHTAASVPPPPGGVPSSAGLDTTDFFAVNQGSCGSCVAFSTRSAMGLRAIAQQQGFVDFAPADIWYVAGYGAQTCPTGSLIDVVMDSMASKMQYIVPAASWPYDPNDPATSLNAVPTSKLATDGVAYVSSSLQVNPQSLDDIKAALAQNWPVVISIPVYWKAGWDTGQLGMPPDGDPLAGYHAIAIVSYSDDTQKVGFVNSWGPTFGNQGFGTITYEFIQKNSQGGRAITSMSFKSMQNMPGSCQQDSDCGTGQHCDMGTSQCVLNTTCTPNATRCDNGLLFTCNDAGTLETQTQCTSGTCQDAQSCTVTCQQDAECPNGQICTNGNCVSNTSEGCVPGALLRCDMGVQYVCNQQGTGEDQVPCPSKACQDATSCVPPCQSDMECQQGEFCNAGACTTYVCIPGAVRCDSGVLYTCAQDGSGEDQMPCASQQCQDGQGCAPQCYMDNECPEGQFCGNGECHEQVCMPGATRCDMGTLYTCEMNGSGETSTGCPTGACIDTTACEPAPQCIQDTDCQPGQVCDSGNCVEQICMPNAVRCDTGVLYTCNAAGTAEDQQPCPSHVCADSSTCQTN